MIEDYDFWSKVGIERKLDDRYNSFKKRVDMLLFRRYQREYEDAVGSEMIRFYTDDQWTLDAGTTARVATSRAIQIVCRYISTIHGHGSDYEKHIWRYSNDHKNIVRWDAMSKEYEREYRSQFVGYNQVTGEWLSGQGPYLYAIQQRRGSIPF